MICDYFMAVSLSADGLKEYLNTNHLTFPVYVAGKKAARGLGVVGTPSTIVIGSDGNVKKVWRGAHVGKVGDEVSQLFHVDLPEVKTQ